MKIAALPKYEPKGPSARLRFYQFQREFEAAGEEITYYPLFGDDYVESLVKGKRFGPFYILKKYIERARILRTLRNVDLIWLEKELFPWIPGWLEQWLLPRGVPVVLDYDDAVFNIYLHHKSRIIRAIFKNKISSAIRQAQGFISGSCYLDQYAAQSGAEERAFVPTCIRLSDYKLKNSETSDSGAQMPTVGWIGTPSSAKNLESIRGALNRVAEKIPFRFLAVGASNLKWESDTFHFEYAPWAEATEVTQICTFDIGIMPLEDTPFNRGKCGFKLIQYMACGVPVVGSPVGENRVIVSDGDEGLLAASELEWEQTLMKLLSDPALRKDMGSKGRATVEVRYSVEQQFRGLIEFLRKISQTSKGEALKEF